MSLNKFMGIGNLGRDSELRHTQSGQPVLNFSIAITKKWKDANGGKQERTEWVNCVLWGNRGEALAQYLTQGTKVCVEGELRSSKFTDRDGHERYKTEIHVDEVHLLGGGARDQQQGGYQQNDGRQQGHGRQQQSGYGQGQQQRQQQGQRQHGGYQQPQHNAGRQQSQQQPQGRGFTPPPLHGDGFDEDVGF